MASEDRVNSYDFLRGLAILGVMLVHVSHAFPIGIQLFDKVFGYGAKGVQLFFFISAITMCHMWSLRNKETHPTLKFYVRRFLRIAPLFWLAIIFYVSVNQRNDFLQHQIVLTALFLHGFWPDSINSVVPGGWSIAVEMTFYLIFPVVIKAYKDKASFYLVTAGLVYFVNSLLITPLLLNYFQYMDNGLVDNFLYMNFFNQAPVFLLGCFIYFMIEKRFERKLAVILISFVGLWFFGALLLDVVFASKHALFLGTYLAIGVFVWIVIAFKFTFKPLELLGKNSYAIYLSHFFVIDLVSLVINSATYLGSASSFLISFAIVALVSYGFSMLSYKYFEKPIHHISTKLTRGDVLLRKGVNDALLQNNEHLTLSNRSPGRGKTR